MKSRTKLNVTLCAAFLLFVGTNIIWRTSSQEKREGEIAQNQADQPSQKPSLEVQNGEIFIKELSGELRQVTNDGAIKEQPAISPDQQLIAYRGKYDASASRTTTITVIDTQEGKTLHRIPLYSLARFIDKLEWIDNRHIWVEGDGLLTVIDAQAGNQTNYLFASLVGEKFFYLSPDRTKIIFVEGIGKGVPLEYWNHKVLQAVITEKEPAIRRYTGLNMETLQVFPDTEQEQKERVGEPRHLIKSGIAWSTDSSKVAFVDEHLNGFWLVILEPDVIDGQIKVAPFGLVKLADVVDEVNDIEWINDNDAIKVVTKEAIYHVDAQKGTVEKSTPN